jgi:hypothetical protein
VLVAIGRQPPAAHTEKEADVSAAMLSAVLALQAAARSGGTPGSGHGAVQGSALAHAAFLSVSCRANVESFAAGTFRFSYTRARAWGLEDALAGKYSDSVVAQGLYIFDGHDARFELVVGASEQGRITKRIGPDRTSSFFLPVRELTDGRVTLMDLIFMVDPQSLVQLHSPQIVSGTDEFQNRLCFPLGLGSKGQRFFRLFYDLDQATGSAEGFRLESLDPRAELSGNIVTKVVLRGKVGRRTYWVDTDRGSIPLRAEDSFDEGPSRAILLLHEDLRLLEGGGWLPFTRTLVMNRGEVVERIELIEARVHPRPAASSFRLEFPEPTPLMDTVRQLRYRTQKTWDLHHLPGERSADAEKAVPASQAAAPEMPGELERSSSRWWLLLLGIGVVCLVAGMLRVGIRWAPGFRRAQ